MILCGVRRESDTARDMRNTEVGCFLKCGCLIVIIVNILVKTPIKENITCHNIKNTAPGFLVISYVPLLCSNIVVEVFVPVSILDRHDVPYLIKQYFVQK